MKKGQNSARIHSEMVYRTISCIFSDNYNPDQNDPCSSLPQQSVRSSLSLLSYSRGSRSKNFGFPPPRNCVFVHINRGLHTARSLCSTSLILITCGCTTAFLSNQTGYMMEFSLSFSINMKCMSARGEWMTPDLSQSRAV